MMKIKLVISVTCMALVIVKVLPKEIGPAAIVKYENINDGLANYSYAFETSHGVKIIENAEIINPGTDQETYIVHGSFSTIDEDGVTIKIDYLTDGKTLLTQGQDSSSPL